MQWSLHTMSSDSTTKQCPKCLRIIPLDKKFWHKNKRQPNGFACWCKTCCAEYQQSHYRNNSDSRIRQSRTYYNSHKKEASERQKVYNRANYERRKIAVSTRKSRVKGAEGKFTFDEIVGLFRDQQGYCFHCGIDIILTGYHIDHWIPISRGGSNWIENLRLLCPTCNLRKHNKLPCEWDSRYCV